MPGDGDGLTYAMAGVDIDRELGAVGALVAQLAGSSVRQPGTHGAPVDLPGGFGGLLEFGDSILAMATDGVGSKLELAASTGIWAGAGIDCMAMNVNDLLCVGAEPIAFVDYVAVAVPDASIHEQLGASLARAAREARVTLAGGETATLPGLVKGLDLSGTVLGWMPRDAALTGARIAPGDVLIGLPSNGLHSNGFSLVRAVLERTGVDLDAAPPFEHAHPYRQLQFTTDTDQPTLAEVILQPTTLYCDPVVDLFQATRDTADPAQFDALHGLAHITGGGLSNLLRLAPDAGVGYAITDPLPTHPEFRWLQEQGQVAEREMWRTFNMGCGMILVVDAEHASGIQEWLDARLPGTRIIGHVDDTGIVSHPHPEVRFDAY